MSHPMRPFGINNNKSRKSGNFNPRSRSANCNSYVWQQPPPPPCIRGGSSYNSYLPSNRYYTQAVNFIDNNYTARQKNVNYNFRNNDRSWYVNNYSRINSTLQMPPANLNQGKPPDQICTLQSSNQEFFSHELPLQQSSNSRMCFIQSREIFSRDVSLGVDGGEFIIDTEPNYELRDVFSHGSQSQLDSKFYNNSDNYFQQSCSRNSSNSVMFNFSERIISRLIKERGANQDMNNPQTVSHNAISPASNSNAISSAGKNNALIKKNNRRRKRKKNKASTLGKSNNNIPISNTKNNQEIDVIPANSNKKTVEVQECEINLTNCKENSEINPTSEISDISKRTVDCSINLVKENTLNQSHSSKRKSTEEVEDNLISNEQNELENNSKKCRIECRDDPVEISPDLISEEIIGSKQLERDKHNLISDTLIQSNAEKTDLEKKLNKPSVSDSKKSNSGLLKINSKKRRNQNSNNSVHVSNKTKRPSPKKKRSKRNSLITKSFLILERVLAEKERTQVNENSNNRESTSLTTEKNNGQISEDIPQSEVLETDSLEAEENNSVQISQNTQQTELLVSESVPDIPTEQHDEDIIIVESESDNDSIIEVPRSPIPVVDLIDSDAESSQSNNKHKPSKNKKLVGKTRQKSKDIFIVDAEPSESQPSSQCSEINTDFSIDIGITSSTVPEKVIDIPDSEIFATPKSKKKKRRKSARRDGGNLSQTSSTCSDDFVQNDSILNENEPIFTNDSFSSNMNSAIENTTNRVIQVTNTGNLLVDAYETESSCSISDNIEKDIVINNSVKNNSPKQANYHELDLDQFADMITTGQPRNASDKRVSVNTSHCAKPDTTLVYFGDNSQHNIIATDTSMIQNNSDSNSSADETYKDRMKNIEKKGGRNAKMRKRKRKTTENNLKQNSGPNTDCPTTDGDSPETVVMSTSNRTEKSTLSGESTPRRRMDLYERFCYNLRNANTHFDAPTVISSGDSSSENNAIESTKSKQQSNNIDTIDLEDISSPSEPFAVIDLEDISSNESIGIDDETPVNILLNTRMTEDYDYVINTDDNVSRGEERAAILKMRFNTYWNPNRDIFYNKSWGGENYDHLKERSLMPVEKSNWQVSSDKQSPKKKKTKLRCTNCRQPGHIRADCTVPIKVCSMCGSRKHREYRCSESCCLTCFSEGRTFTKTCGRCSNWKYKYCNICKIKGHVAEICPDVWRRYHLTTESGNIVKPKPIEVQEGVKLWCSVCASHGHLSEECRYYYNVSSNPPGPLSVQSYSKVNVSLNTPTKASLSNNRKHKHDLWDIHKDCFQNISSDRNQAEPRTLTTNSNITSEAVNISNEIESTPVVSQNLNTLQQNSDKSPLNSNDILLSSSNILNERLNNSVENPVLNFENHVESDFIPLILKEFDMRENETQKSEKEHSSLENLGETFKSNILVFNQNENESEIILTQKDAEYFANDVGKKLMDDLMLKYQANIQIISRVQYSILKVICSSENRSSICDKLREFLLPTNNNPGQISFRTMYGHVISFLRLSSKESLQTKLYESYKSLSVTNSIIPKFLKRRLMSLINFMFNDNKEKYLKILKAFAQSHKDKNIDPSSINEAYRLIFVEEKSNFEELMHEYFANMNTKKVIPNNNNKTNKIVSLLQPFKGIKTERIKRSENVIKQKLSNLNNHQISNESKTAGNNKTDIQNRKNNRRSRKKRVSKMLEKQRTENNANKKRVTQKRKKKND